MVVSCTASVSFRTDHQPTSIPLPRPGYSVVIRAFPSGANWNVMARAAAPAAGGWLAAHTVSWLHGISPAVAGGWEPPAAPEVSGALPLPQAPAASGIAIRTSHPLQRKRNVIASS